MFPNLHIEKNNLIRELIKKGISDHKVLNAISKVPRERFISAELVLRTYEDSALPIAFGQTISQPYTVAFMSQLLEVFDGAKVLEIGTGSGYQSAILSEMGCQVFSIESIKELHDFSKKILSELNYKIYQKTGDGTEGWEEESPFDRIIVTAGSDQIPKSLLKQLMIGGKLVIPIGDRFVQTMNLVEKQSDSDFKISFHDTFRFVPLIGKEGWSF